MKFLLSLIFSSFLLFTKTLVSQQRIVFDGGALMKMNNNINLVIDNPNPNAIQVLSTGNIISEAENNVVKWNINSNTGNYIVPFATASFSSIPLQLNITNAGLASNGAIYFSTYETATDSNLIYPSDVTHLNSNCRDSVGLFLVDRFWRIDAQNYTTKPTPIISFGYDNANNEIGGTNTITESKLKAQRFNNSSNSWETPQKLYGITNTTLKAVENVNVNPFDFFKSWTLVDTSIMNIPVSITSASTILICEGSLAIIIATGATSYTLIPDGVISNTTFSVSPIITTTYNVIGAIGSGSAVCLSIPNATNTVTVFVSANPTLTLIANNINCFGNSTGVITSSVSSNSSFTYSWSNGATTSSITGLPIGDYTLAVTNTNNCSATQSITLTQTLPIIVTQTTVQPSCDTQPTGLLAIAITGGAPTYNILWSNGANNTSISQLPTGAITATITDNNGCVTIYNTIIDEEKCLTTYIPQLISPNADGKNDFFTINTIAYFPNNKLEIYNRWGNLVYEKNNYNNNFNGKCNVSNCVGGDLLPSATYFVVFDFGDGATAPYKGYLELRY